MYLHRYSIQENERFKEGCWQIVTSHGNTQHYFSTFIMSLWVFADILQDLHDVHDCLQDLKVMITY